MILRGTLFAEAPIYRGNARKTLFTRDGDGKQRLVSLAGEIDGTAQSLMDAFIGQSRNGQNTGLLNQLWARLYGGQMPGSLINRVDCKLQRESYPQNNLFDLRMGVKLDEDRWAVEANANYKYETLFRNSGFDFVLDVNDSVLQRDGNSDRLYYVLQELQAGRFWYGAAKSKGLGRCRLELKLPFSPAKDPPATRPGVNHLQITLTFNAANPLLVGWNWGKVDYENVPAFRAVEGRLLVGAMRDLPTPIRQRLEMGIGGPILNPEDWKRKLAEYLPRVTAIWLREQSQAETTVLSLSDPALKKLSKGKYGLSSKVISQLEPLVGQPFATTTAAEGAVKQALADKGNMAKRVVEVMERKVTVAYGLNPEVWDELVGLGLGGDSSASQTLAKAITEVLGDEATLVERLGRAYQPVLSHLYQQVDQHLTMLQSDAWVDTEIASREQHLKIKQMLSTGKITEKQWSIRREAPQGVSVTAWQEFLDAHRQVQFSHLLNPRNLNKSITNDRNFIEFLIAYRDRTRQELAQPHLIDFRGGGINNREISRQYGKHYDTVFMRMLSWTASDREQGTWEVYIPGSTIKGAFRKRAAQILKTLWGESNKTDQVLDTLFGKQRQRGLIFFSDAYLANPNLPEQAWCSMDGVRMDPKTGQPLEQAKHDYLFAYGSQLTFNLQIDLQDLNEQHGVAVNVLHHLLQDFQQGDIPLGGEKTVGLGWVKAQVARLKWLTTNPAGIGKKLFGTLETAPAGIWHQAELTGPAAAELLLPSDSLAAAMKVSSEPPQARGGFVSHRAFGGYCGNLHLEAQVLTPISIQESGQPSFAAMLADGPVNGWDFFSMSPPEAAHRENDRRYALPSRSLKGMLRHIYTIASNAGQNSANIGSLNPADGLFGWVGQGPNQALMGRLSFGFGYFATPELAWFKVPYPYGGWRYNDGQWQHTPGNSVAKVTVANKWRLFPHAPLAPLVQQLATFSADTAQASYLRAIMPGARAHFDLRFWNLSEEELQRLVWCITLEDGLAHKLGKHRHLGFGSIRLNVMPDSFLIDWPSRYTAQAGQAWRLPLKAEQWLNPKVINHYADVKKALNAHGL